MTLLHSLRRLIAAWWRCDRVRISPREGELLRLRPGSILKLRGHVAEIHSKSIQKTPLATVVGYDCQTGTFPGRLDVHLGDAETRLEIVWLAGGRKEQLQPHEIEVFG